MVTITFNTKGYDGFIDFIKAYAILCVLFGHTFPFLDEVGYGLWAGMQVPLFVLVQVLHSYKKGEPSFFFAKIIKRVLAPFIIVEIITAGKALFFFGYDANVLINKFFNGGGYGPGAYYPWIYVQIALFLPLVFRALNKCNEYFALFIFLFLCEGLEIVCSIINLPDSIYRLLAIRYFFLIFFGWIWVKKGIRIDKWTVSISIISFVSVVYFEYFSVNDEPFFYNTNWSYHRWPCYFYVAYGLTSLLYTLYRWANKHFFIMCWIKKLAKASYEIFLVQMSIIWLFKYTMLSMFHSQVAQFVIWIVIVWVFSIGGGIILNRIINRVLFSNK